MKIQQSENDMTHYHIKDTSPIPLCTLIHWKATYEQHTRTKVKLILNRNNTHTSTILPKLQNILVNKTLNKYRSVLYSVRHHSEKVSPTYGLHTELHTYDHIKTIVVEIEAFYKLL